MLARHALPCLGVLAFCAIQAQAARPEAKATRTPTPPKINAVLNEPAWRTAAELKGFVLAGSDKPATQQTAVRVLFDGQALYFGVTCMESKMGEVAAKASARDTGVDADDHVEILLGPTHDRFNFLHFAVSITGARFDASGDGAGVSADWDAAWEAKVRRVKDRWIAEVAIPFACLQLSDKVGSIWDFNVARVEGPHQERSSWSPAGAQFHAPATFGALSGLDVDFKPYHVSLGLAKPLSAGFGRNMAAVRLANMAAQARKLRCDLGVYPPSEKPRPVRGAAVEVAPHASVACELAFQVFERGAHRLVFKAVDAETHRVAASFERNFDLSTPVEHSLFHSYYRDDVSVRSRLNIDDAQLGAYRLAATLLPAEGGDALAKRVMTPNAREIVVKLAPKAMPKGRYRVVMRLERAGKVVHEQTLAFAHLRDRPVKELRVRHRDDLTLIVDGKPFFPIGIYAPPVTQKMLDEYKAAGVNTVKTYGGAPTAAKMILDRYWANGFKTCVILGGQLDFSRDPETRKKKLEAIVAAVGSHPGLLMYESIDEPAWGSQSADGLLLGYECLRQLDRHHPVWTNHAPRNHIATLAYFNRATDLAGCDIYPVPEPANQSNLPNKTLSVVGDETDKNRAAVLDEKPILMVLQGFAWRALRRRDDPQAVYPTLAQQRFMAYDAIVHGARGILYWGVQYTPRPSQAWADVKKMIHELSRLHPMFVAPAMAPPAIKSDTGGVEAIMRKVGEHTFLVAINNENRPAAATVNGLPATLRTLRVLYENGRRLHVHNRAFEVKLPGYGVIVATDDDAFDDTRPNYSEELKPAKAAPKLEDLRQPGNLVANPSFEFDSTGAGLPDFWHCRYPFSAVLTTGRPHTGKRCLEFASPINDFAPLLVQHNLPVEANREYELSMWFRTDGGAITARVYAEWVVGGKFHGAIAPWTRGGGQWQRLVRRFKATPPPGDKLYVVVQSKGKGKVWIDDVKLAPVGE